MGRCCVLSCTNRPERKIENITFHRFPKKLKIRNLWTLLTGRALKNWQPTENARICSKHFESNCFRKTKHLTYLYPDSIPTLFIPLSEEDNSITVEQHKPVEVAMEVESSLGLREAILDTDQLSTSTCTPIKVFEVEDGTSIAGLAPLELETPRKRKLRKQLNRKTILAESRKRKLAVLRSRTWRLKKKTAELSKIIEQLKSRHMINEESAAMLYSIEPANRYIFKKTLSKNTTERKYSPELRKFALTLNFISPRAYNYVRNQFNTCLPHPRTLSRWYQCVEGDPGFSQESLEAIKLLNRANSEKKPSHKLLCALSFDEMAIRKFVDFDGKQCFGFVNYGNNVESDQLAREALVFMITCVNGSWKIPLGYFLIDGITAEQKAGLVRTCIEMIHRECGVEIISVTFDGCPTNFAMAKLLGCNLNICEIDSSFSIGDKKVVIFPDPSHMLKLIRNTLAQKEKITDGHGRTISWEYIKLLFELQENEGLHLGNKLKKAHVNFTKQIMKVKLAAQVFSESVADAIEFCSNELNIDSFRKSEATIEFIRKINNLFDVMNSRNMNAYAFKKPLFEGNFAKQKIFLEDMFVYLSRLKLDGRNILDTNRKTGFWGFIICIRSILSLYENHARSNSLRFLCTYKFSQDHLEYFFSAIRAKGGFNNNPTARQFKSAFKRLLVHGELKHITTGNCIPLQEINILTYSKPEVAINKTTDRSRLIEDSIDDSGNNICGDIDLIRTVEDHDYLTDPSRLTEFSRQVIIYIGGFVVHKLQKELKCQECLSALISDKYTSLQMKKDKGGLHYPSKDVVSICEISEKIFRQNKSLSKRNIFHAILQECLRKCLNVKLFCQLAHHFHSQSFLDCHFPLLIKAICLKYIKVRIHFATKKISEEDNKIRNFYNKLILFNGQ